MAPDISREMNVTSYTFEDSQDCVIVNFYANGKVEQKDIEVLSEIDALEVLTPGILFI